MRAEPALSSGQTLTRYYRLGDDRKLGVVYCANRPAAIYDFCLATGKVGDEHDDGGNKNVKWRVSTATIQSDSDTRSARSARVLHPPATSKSKSGPQRLPLVVFLSNPVGGPHSSCASLHAAALPPPGSNDPPKTTVLVPVVEKVAKLAAFPGLYVDQLPQQCFLETEEGPAVVMSSIWRSRRVPILVNLRTGKVESLLSWPAPNEDDVVLPYLSKQQELQSIGVLGTDGGSRIVGLRSGPCSPPCVVLGDVNKRKNGAVEWLVVKSPRLDDKGECV